MKQDQKGAVELILAVGIAAVIVIVVGAFILVQSNESNDTESSPNQAVEQVINGQSKTYDNQEIDNSEAINTNQPSENNAEQESTVLADGEFNGTTGTFKASGYLYTEKVPEAWCEENCSELNRSFFYIVKTSNEYILDFIKKWEGNSYVAERAISFGCLTSQGTIEADQTPSGKTLVISADDTEKLLKATKDSPVEVEASRLTEPQGGPGFSCTSLFDVVTLI